MRSHHLTLNVKLCPGLRLSRQVLPFEAYATAYEKASRIFGA